MSEAKQKKVRYMTPKGVANYPWLNAPDTKFKPEGEYRVTLRMKSDDPALVKLLATLQPLHDAAVAEAKKNPKNKGKTLTTWPIAAEIFEEDGTETGLTEMKFKMIASGISKKTGKPWEMRPDIFDAAGQPLNPDLKIFGGSVMKVSFSATPYDKPIGNGLSLRLEAVQVIKRSEGARDAAQFGFGNEADDEDADPDNGGNDVQGDGEGADPAIAGDKF